MNNDKQQDRPEYTEPKVVDYGTLNELTALTGGNFTDVPQGGSIGNAGQSTP